MASLGNNRRSENPRDISIDDFSNNATVFQRSLKRVSSVIDKEYFINDPSTKSFTEELTAETAPSQYLKQTDTFSTFKTRVFIEALIYHLLFYFALGPLVSVIMYMTSGPKLARNMQFYGPSLIFFTQLICYLFFFTGLIMFVLDKFNIQEIYIYTLAYLIAIRCVIIAIKYAYLSPEKIYILRNFEIPLQTTAKDQVFGGWNSQPDLVIINSLKNTIKRHEIDERLLYTQFITSLKKENMNLLKHYEIMIKQNLEESNQDDTSYRDINPSENVVYGLSIIYNLIKRYNEEHKYSTLRRLVICFAVAIVLNLSPLVIRYSSDNQIQFGLYLGDCLEAVSVNVALALSCSYFAIANLAFFSITITDIRRQVFLMKQLSYMICPQRENEYDEKRIYPTLNLFDVISLRTWSGLRRLSIDYGIHFTRRLQVGVSVQLLFYITLGVILTLRQLFNIATSGVIQSQVIVVGQIILFIILMFMMFRSGAYINDVFRIEKSYLKQIRSVLVDVNNLKDLYFEKGMNSKNYLYQIVRERVKETLSEYQGREFYIKVDQYLKELIDVTKELQAEVAFDAENNPYKVLGITASFTTFQRILIAIGSLVLTLIRKLIKEYF